MSKINDLTGMKFGRLIALEAIGTDPKVGNKIWLCQCDCGGVVKAVSSSLMRGNTRSCGCLRKEASKSRLMTHGRSRCREYIIYLNMKDRCYNEKNTFYPHYGGRGITVSPRWLGDDGFENFLADMGEPPEGMSLDRIDNDGHYTPENCRWATDSQQNKNTRRNRYFEFNGRKQTLTDWANELGFNKVTLWSRIKRGWAVESAFTAPVKR